MAFTADFEKFKFPESAFQGKRVLITGSGKDGGIGQALALAAAANGSEVVGVHFNSSYRDGSVLRRPPHFGASGPETIPIAKSLIR